MKLHKTNKSSHKKAIIITVIVLLVLGIGASAFAIYRSGVDSQSSIEEAQQKQAQDENNQGKKDFIENTTTDGGTSTDTPATTPASSSVSVTAQKETNGSVTIFSKLTSISAGTCSLTITNGSNVVTKSADVLYQTDYSTCAGFTVSSLEASQLGTGTWSINLSVTVAGAAYADTTNFIYGAG
jgi:type II secretory pathway pseudopilin PulG